MNWKTIAHDCPDALAMAKDHDVDHDTRALYAFFDEKQVVVLPTFHQGEVLGWGYEVKTPTRFVREEANYSSRLSAQDAGFEQAFRELQKLILQGNA